MLVFLLLAGCGAPDVALTLALDDTHPSMVLVSATTDATGCTAAWSTADTSGQAAASPTDDGWRAVLFGIPAGADVDVALRCDRVTSDAASITTAAPPDDVTPWTVNQRAEGLTERYVLDTAFAPSGETPGYIAVHDLDGRVVWWIPDPTGPSFSAHYDAEAGVVYGLEGDGLVLAPIAGPDVRWPVPQGHHDTLALGGGRYLMTVFEQREVDGDLVQGDTLVELDGATGALTTVWNAFDALPVVPNGGWDARTPDGYADWTHVNGLARDPDTGRIYVSLYWAHSILVLDPDTYALLGAIGGDDATLQVDVPFGPQHSPVLRDGALWMFDNGSNVEAGSTVAAYTFNGSHGTRTWAWRPDPAHFDIVLGSVDPADDAILTSWGDTAQVQILSPDSQLIGDYALADGLMSGATRFFAP